MLDASEVLGSARPNGRGRLEMGWEDSYVVDIEPMCKYDKDVGDGVCGGGGGGGGVSDSVGGSRGAMGTGIDSCLGNGDIGCCCYCCCQDEVKTGASGDR